MELYGVSTISVGNLEGYAGSVGYVQSSVVVASGILDSISHSVTYLGNSDINPCLVEGKGGEVLYIRTTSIIVDCPSDRNINSFKSSACFLTSDMSSGGHCRGS